MTNNTGPVIVVGADGSQCSTDAVKWAASYATATGGLLLLVTAWHLPAAYGVPIGFDGFDPEEDARKVVEAAAADVDLPSDRVTTKVAPGPAGDALIRCAEHADLLVVGSRGHGTLAAALLGSTSAYLVHHATCPVVVVR
jgi:nucleotide-binding universal stress UspA family protein